LRALWNSHAHNQSQTYSPKDVASHGVRLALAGVVAGAAASLLLARYMKTLLYGVQPIDPIVMAVSCLALGAVAALASFVPA
jgi:hypothetical protein